MPQPTTEEDDQQDTKRARLYGAISPEVPPDLLDSLTFLQAFGEGAPAPIAELTPTGEVSSLKTLHKRSRYASPLVSLAYHSWVDQVQ